MVSTQRRQLIDEYSSYSVRSTAPKTTARVALLESPVERSMPVAFASSAQPRVDTARVVRTSVPRQQADQSRPHLVPLESPVVKSRKTPVLLRINRVMQASLIALCGIAIFTYGLDVNESHTVGRMQEQARRLMEQNTELSQRLLQLISYQDLSKNVANHTTLQVPEQVKIVSEVPAPRLIAFKPAKHHLPLMTGY